MDLRECRRLKDTAEEALRRAERAAGAYKHLLDRLRKEFDCSSIADGEALLAELEAEQRRARKEVLREREHVGREWGGKLDNSG